MAQGSATDADGDGVVSKAEFVQWHSSQRGWPPTDAETRRFVAADADGDGVTTAAEFELCLHDDSSAAGPAAAAAAATVPAAVVAVAAEPFDAQAADELSIGALVVPDCSFGAPAGAC